MESLQLLTHIDIDMRSSDNGIMRTWAASIINPGSAHTDQCECSGGGYARLVQPQPAHTREEPGHDRSSAFSDH
jgi:hypothetical protein